MKKKIRDIVVIGNLLLCLSFFGCATSNPFFDQINSTDENTQKHGLWIDKESSTNRLTMMTYKHGKKHGKFSEYHENGVLSITGKYKNDLKHGVWKFFTPEGILSSKAKYTSGKLLENQINNLDWSSVKDEKE